MHGLRTLSVCMVLALMLVFSIHLLHACTTFGEYPLALCLLALLLMRLVFSPCLSASIVYRYAG